ncbi:cell division protein FtsQ [Alkalibacterium subtropicum]|uniref:Cell division protein DivIB n=1 Tax=Alkalibacterium subtropicum TaxID=753702 RepID=A0A1I1EIL1_9LACT|nr:FtsQ-type POTRA domain-containing protein [Alkalibacterium subtropicum]SFB84840.1 cell division protein FtsQ [Alkalibacterium subtropicum]
MSKKEQNLIKTENGKAVPDSTGADVKNDKRRLMKWGLVVTLFVTAALLSLYFVSPYRLIENISVSGSEEVYDQAVLDSSGLSSGQSIWENYLNRNEIEERILEANPQVKKAEVALTGMQTFTITIEEYSTVAYLSNDNSYKKILENGDILNETVPRIHSSQPILNDFEEGRPLEKIIVEYEKVDEEVKALISEIDFLNNERNRLLVRVFMNDGNEVLVNVPNFSDRLNYYQGMKEAVENRKGLFDLEAGAYFIPFSTEEESEKIEDFE